MFSFVVEDAKGVGIDASEINNIEKKYGITIPKLLKEYYQNYNGCKIKCCCFLVDGYECEVSRITPIGTTGLTFEKIVDNDRADGFIDPNLYPIASNRGGDQYYWNVKSGVVYLIFADDVENPFRIADSVDSFFDILHNC